MLSIYGTSTGSHSIVQEGKNQFSGRGYSIPPIVDVNGNTIPFGVQGAQGPGGESVFDCGSSRVTSKAVETAAQRHFTPLCDASNGMMPRTWKVIGVIRVLVQVSPVSEAKLSCTTTVLLSIFIIFYTNKRKGMNHDHATSGWLSVAVP